MTLRLQNRTALYDIKAFKRHPVPSSLVQTLHLVDLMAKCVHCGATHDPSEVFLSRLSTFEGVYLAPSASFALFSFFFVDTAAQCSAPRTSH